MSIVLLVIACCALFAYVPLFLIVAYGHRPRPAKRPVNEVLAEAYAEGRISRERFELMMDEVHQSMPTLDAPYPMVRDD